jgi:hypothetical protein
VSIVDHELLSEHDRALLAFEADWSQHSAAKEEAIRGVFAVSAARYYQLLNAVIDSPAAVRHDPMLVRRLLRARDDRAEARAKRAFTSSSRADHHGRARPNESNEDHGEVPQRPI